jgi:hypothetical protein
MKWFIAALGLIFFPTIGAAQQPRAALDRYCSTCHNQRLIAKEVFVANTRKEWPSTYALLKKLMAERGLPAD